MTVIAWDGKTLAADKRCTQEDGAINTTTKILRFNGFLYAITGNSSVARELLTWCLDGADPKAFPAAAREDKASLIVINRVPVYGVQIVHYTASPSPTNLHQSVGAWGCGRDFARAAMHLGRSAEEAVRIACELNAFCGNGIDTLTLED